MGEIINLRKARKTRERAAKANDAESNRARYGRTLSERESDRLHAEQATRRLDGARVMQDDPEA